MYWQYLALPWALLRISFLRQFAYASAAFWGLVTNFFFGILRLAILLALFEARPQVDGFSQQDAISYIMLTQVILMPLAIFGWSDLLRSIHKGEIASDLLRPTQLLSFYCWQDAGRMLGQLVLRGLPMLLVFWLIWPVSPPAQPLLALISFVMAWSCGFAWRFVVNCAAFWSADASGMARFAWAIWCFGCGFLMPLALFPDWLQSVLRYTPFPSMLNSFIDIWLGNIPPSAVGWLLAEQAIWAMLLFALAQCLLSRGLRRLEVAGG